MCFQAGPGLKLAAFQTLLILFSPLPGWSQVPWKTCCEYFGGKQAYNALHQFQIDKGADVGNVL